MANTPATQPERNAYTGMDAAKPNSERTVYMHYKRTGNTMVLTHTETTVNTSAATHEHKSDRAE